MPEFTITDGKTMETIFTTNDIKEYEKFMKMNKIKQKEYAKSKMENKLKKFTCVNCCEDDFDEKDGPELDVETFGGWVCEHCYDFLVDGVEE